jgi:hypothetical protein
VGLVQILWYDVSVGLVWIDPAQDRTKRGVLVNAVMKFRIPQNANNLLTDKGVLASEEEPRFM